MTTTMTTLRSATASLPWRAALLASVLVLVVGCASRGPGRSWPSSGGDGPEATPPTNLMQVADAEPRLEPIRPGGANKPYVVFGQRYEPLTQDVPYREQGLASWYGRLYHGKPTANGELYDMYAMTAAHPTLPIPSYARIRNPANGREVVVRINDRGPFRTGRIVDLSYTAALKLDILRGTTPVELERITGDDIRSGAWHGTQAAAAAPSSMPLPLLVSAPVPAAGVAITAAPTVLPSPVDPPAPAPAATSPVAAPSALDLPSVPAVSEGAPGYWLQLGAFRQHDGALLFQKQVEAQVAWLAPLLRVFESAALYKLQAGPYRSRDDARDAGERLRAALQLVPVIVERH